MAACIRLRFCLVFSKKYTCNLYFYLYYKLINYNLTLLKLMEKQPINYSLHSVKN